MFPPPLILGQEEKKITGHFSIISYPIVSHQLNIVNVCVDSFNVLIVPVLTITVIRTTVTTIVQAYMYTETQKFLDTL